MYKSIFSRLFIKRLDLTFGWSDIIIFRCVIHMFGGHHCTEAFRNVVYQKVTFDILPSPVEIIFPTV